jgi:flagellar protein FliO/FliZ
VIDAAAVDGRRKLVIIRRDNVEHLLMIGGPTDVVVETNIVRAAGVGARDAAPARSTTEPAMRATPEPVSPVSWQPEPAPAPAGTMRGPRAVPDDTWHTTDEPSPAVQAPPAIQAPPPLQMPPVRAARPAETLASLAQELSRPTAVQPEPAPPVMVQPPPMPAAAAPQMVPAPDQSLAEMAQRLEAALRRPAAQKVVAEAATARVAVGTDVKAPARQSRVVVAAQTKGGAQPAAQPNNLEQEMASLLNKPGKT